MTAAASRSHKLKVRRGGLPARTRGPGGRARGAPTGRVGLRVDRRLERRGGHRLRAAAQSSAIAPPRCRRCEGVGCRLRRRPRARVQRGGRSAASRTTSRRCRRRLDPPPCACRRRRGKRRRSRHSAREQSLACQLHLSRASLRSVGPPTLSATRAQVSSSREWSPRQWSGCWGRAGRDRPRPPRAGTPGLVDLGRRDLLRTTSRSSQAIDRADARLYLAKEPRRNAVDRDRQATPRCRPGNRPHLIGAVHLRKGQGCAPRGTRHRCDDGERGERQRSTCSRQRAPRRRCGDQADRAGARREGCGHRRSCRRRRRRGGRRSRWRASVVMPLPMPSSTRPAITAAVRARRRRRRSRARSARTRRRSSGGPAKPGGQRPRARPAQGPGKTPVSPTAKAAKGRCSRARRHGHGAHRSGMEYRPGSELLASATPAMSADGSLLATPRSTGGGDVIESPW